MTITVSSATTGSAVLAETLKIFDFERLKDEQEALILASIAGKDVLGILPTGYGKSACYQIPGVALGETTLVISPLIALQEDQVQALRRRKIQAYAIHSNMDDIKRMAAVFYFRYPRPGQASFLYISPELLLSEWFEEHFGHVRFDRIAIDEAHCVSTWGGAFRPDYQRIGLAVEKYRIPHCAAFTATVDEKIERDIRARLPLKDDLVRVEADPFRPNLAVKVVHARQGNSVKTKHGRQKIRTLVNTLSTPEYDGPAIVYFSSRNGAAALYGAMRDSEFFRETGRKAYLFHAHLPYEDKQLALEGFLEGDKPVVFATSAFGLGIDRPDVRQILHYDVPYTLIDYAQQIGRGGRDGLPSLCTALHDSGAFLGTQTVRVNREVPTYDFVERVLANVIKTIAGVSPEKRSGYGLRAYKTRLVALTEANDEIKSKAQYLRKIDNALAILQGVGLIKDTLGGLVARSVIPATPPHRALIEQTKMQPRMLLREKERLDEFFSAEEPDQALLWSLIRRP